MKRSLFKITVRLIGIGAISGLTLSTVGSAQIPITEPYSFSDILGFLVFIWGFYFLGVLLGEAINNLRD
jgi:hypothetical protein